MSFLVTETDRINEIDVRDLRNIGKLDYITFFPQSEDAKGKSRHLNRIIWGKWNTACNSQTLGGPV